MAQAMTQANLAMAQADDDARLSMIIKSQAHLSMVAQHDAKRKGQSLPWLKLMMMHGST